MSNDGEIMNEIFQALSHPIRRLILEEISIEGSVSYSYLTELTSLKSGPLYHHLRKISIFIYQTEDKLYHLSDQGIQAIEILRRSEKGEFESVVTLTEDIPKIITFFGLSLAPIIYYFSKNPLRVIIEFIIFGIICGYLSSVSDILLIGTFAITKSNPIYISYLSIILSWLVVGGLTELSSRFIFKKKGKSMNTACSSSALITNCNIFSIY